MMHNDNNDLSVFFVCFCALNDQIKIKNVLFTTIGLAQSDYKETKKSILCAIKR